VEMFLWADRLLDARTMGYGEWESARNGTAGAVDLIPKDIVLCDWHYELRTNYPFRAVPVGRVSVYGPLAGSRCPPPRPSANSRADSTATGWSAIFARLGSGQDSSLAEWPPLVE